MTLTLPDIGIPLLQFWVFLAFFLGFAIKVPMFPFHTWLPDAHVEAPTAGSVILAGVLLKMGTYGFLRFSLPLLPEASDASDDRADRWRSSRSSASSTARWSSSMQKDMKKLVAYSSVSHLGFCTLGIFALNPTGLSGSRPAADQPRHLDRHALPDRRHRLRAAAHARDRGVRRLCQRDAGLRHDRLIMFLLARWDCRC